MWGAEVYFISFICLTFQLPQAYQLSKRVISKALIKTKLKELEQDSVNWNSVNELKLARQSLAQLTDQAWACLTLQWTGKTEFLEDCTNPLENLFERWKSVVFSVVEMPPMNNWSN